MAVGTGKIQAGCEAASRVACALIFLAIPPLDRGLAATDRAATRSLFATSRGLPDTAVGTPEQHQA